MDLKLFSSARFMVGEALRFPGGQDNFGISHTDSYLSVKLVPSFVLYIFQLIFGVLLLQMNEARILLHGIPVPFLTNE